MSSQYGFRPSQEQINLYTHKLTCSFFLSLYQLSSCVAPFHCVAWIKAHFISPLFYQFSCFLTITLVLLFFLFLVLSTYSLFISLKWFFKMYAINFLYDFILISFPLVFTSWFLLRPSLYPHVWLPRLLPWSRYPHSLCYWPWYNGLVRVVPPLISCSVPESVNGTRWHQYTSTSQWSMWALRFNKGKQGLQQLRVGCHTRASDVCTAASVRASLPSGDPQM